MLREVGLRKMKPINKDAKLLIRSYIDNIEEYLKTKSKMHPNIIDGILNEINDFIYIRSTELAKDKIVYSNVLKAIEECGSPSDICEQYLEDDVFDGRHITSNIIVNEKSKPLFKVKASEPDASQSTHPASLLISSPTTYLNQLERFPIFGLYRICSVILYLVFNMYLVTSIFLFLYSYHSSYSLQETHNFCVGVTWSIILLPGVYFLLEGWLISDWKNRKESQGFDRTNDDRVVILISRLSVFILLIKASLLPLPQYFLIIFSILFVLMLWMERQHASNLWGTTISPSINDLAHLLESGQIIAHIKQVLNEWLSLLKTRSNLERSFFLFSAFLLVFNCFFPWFYGWDRLYFPLEVFLDMRISFNLNYLINGLIIQSIMAAILLVSGIILSNAKTGFKDEKHNRLISANIWIVRLVLLRTLFMPLSYDLDVGLGGITFILVFLWFLFEFSVNRQQSKILVQSVASGLKYLGSERKPYVSPERTSSSPVRSELSKSGNQHVGITQARTHLQTYQDPVPIIDYQSPVVKIIIFLFSAMARIIRKIFSLSVLALYTLAKPTYAFGKALTITIILLFGSIIEVLLVIVAILTQLGTDGSYIVPTFTFDLNLHPAYESMYTFGGYVIWSWYVLGILAAQIFILVIIEWLQFARKRDDGVIVLFFRNISRILLLIVAFGSIYQGLYYFDTYAPLRLFFIIILVIFMEITTLKIRLERKQWQVATTNSKQDIESAETGVQSNQND